jgi:hypothetical protein
MSDEKSQTWFLGWLRIEPMTGNESPPETLGRALRESKDLETFFSSRSA